MKKWKCTVCGYIHEGPTPPDKCPICGVGPEKFVLLEDTQSDDSMSPETKDALQNLMFNLSYGLYVITSKEGNHYNGMMSNSFLQITDSPLRGSVCINKGTRTCEMIQKSNVFGVSVLNQKNHDLVKHFGFQSGHDVDKFANMSYVTGEKTGCPAIIGTICFLELEVEQKIDLGTHFMFIGKVVGGESLAGGDPMTYAYYRKTR
ncbi:MAG: flavin reductase [Eubacteriaceae bacterium]|nr:flavin reductase [Eubacteriaceae bacterium]MDD4508984.1 flavin reductase [Eubacteriaceae bacterium]